MIIYNLIKKFNIFLLLSFVFIFCQVSSHTCRAEGLSRITIEATQPEKLQLSVGKSIIIQSSEKVKRVSLSAPEVADAIVLTPYQIYITGKTSGVSNLTIWKAGDKVSAIAELEVSPDIVRLKEKLHEILPEEKDIRVTTSHDRITLSGTVSSTAVGSQVMDISKSFVQGKEEEKGNDKVMNLLEVAGVHQVMLEVRISEIQRSLLKDFGVNFNFISEKGTNMGIGLLNNLTSIASIRSPSSRSLTTAASNKINGIYQFLSNGATWTTFIDALKEEGLIKVLAEPTLITLSGKTANFLAGGEFPVPVPQSTSGGGTPTITIEYKPFGVGLNFTPTVLSNKKISMQVAPEVSELNFGNAVAFQGFIIPALDTRRVSTVVELADGQSFAIAGLLKDNVKEQIDKYPVLGDIPILGALFRSNSFRKDETELVVIVTPHLVKPLDMAKQTLPTDQFIEPDDFEFYLLGSLEGKEKNKSSEPAASPEASPAVPNKGLEGNFGHIVPK